MAEFSKDNKNDFKPSEDEEWFLVHDSAVTNTNPDSIVEARINTTPICPNMTNREFRVMTKRLLGWAAMATDRRLQDLNRNDAETRNRMQYTFRRKRIWLLKFAGFQK